MKMSARLLLSFLVPGIMLVGFAASPAMAQDKAKDAKAAPAAKAEKGKITRKVLIDNDKVLVLENTYRPGDVNTEVLTSYRIQHILQGGTLERTYADGKKEKVELKTGATRVLESPKPGQTYSTKNIGKTTIVNLIVSLK
jgi:hypothetical protein